MGSKKSNHRIPIFPATTSPRSFYQIILPSTVHDHKLRVPKDFAKKYENELSSSVTLTVRSGQVSHVGVEKTDKTLWFADGWNEFSENHSIGCGFFVVFNYEGNSKFNVLIFDLTATEIHNPQKSVGISKEPNKGQRCPVSNKEKGGSNAFVKKLGCPPSRTAPVSLENEILDECGDQSRTGKRCCRSLIENLSAFAPEFSRRITERGISGISISFLESLRPNFPYSTRNKRYQMEDQRNIVDVENVTVLCRGKMKAEMRESPKSSADKSLKEKRNLARNVKNLAAVPFVPHCDLRNRSRLKSHIHREDKEGQCKQSDSSFVQDAVHMSKDGQQVKVEHEEAEELLGVNDSRNISTMRSVTTQGRDNAVIALMMFKPNKPFFTKILKPYNVLKSLILNLPPGFAKKYLHRISDSIELQVSGGKKWTVHCIRVNDTVRCLSRGWRQFVQDNDLWEGDVCVFELIQVLNAVLKVSIFRASENQPL